MLAVPYLAVACGTCAAGAALLPGLLGLNSFEMVKSRTRETGEALSSVG